LAPNIDIIDEWIKIRSNFDKRVHLGGLERRIKALRRLWKEMLPRVGKRRYVCLSVILLDGYKY